MPFKKVNNTYKYDEQANKRNFYKDAQTRDIEVS